MSKNLSAKNYQENKEKLQKKAHERYQNLSKEEKEKRDNMAMNNTKIYLKKKNKSLFTNILGIMNIMIKLKFKSNIFQSSKQSVFL